MATRIILNLWSKRRLGIQQEHDRIVITIGALQHALLHLVFLQGKLMQENMAANKQLRPSPCSDTHIFVWSDPVLDEVWCVVTHGHAIAAIRAHALEVSAAQRSTSVLPVLCLDAQPLQASTPICRSYCAKP